MELIDVTTEVLDCARFMLSSIKPSDWNEQNRFLPGDVSSMQGLLSYDNSPCTREIVDCFAPDHPARIIAVMKGAQIGFSTTVIEAAIAWIISQCPGNILYSVGHEKLLEDTMRKIDRTIDNSGIRHLIGDNSQRARKTKTGDTDQMKEYPLGYLKLLTINPKTLRNISMQYGFIDDWESVKGFSKQAGSNRKLVEQRFAAYAKKMKLCYASSPEEKETSNIEPVYLLGDQRKYFVPCPCCGEFINWEWSLPSQKVVDGVVREKVMCGITWELDERGKLIPESVGYKCQKCEEVFDDKNKMELMRLGHWKPTAEPSEPGYYSYHLSALYASSFMYDWLHYVRDWLEAHPVGKPRDEELYKTHRNLCLGLTYEPPGMHIQATQLMANISTYKIGTVPEKRSIAEGNGRIVMLSLCADLGGLMRGYNSDHDDVRLDASVVAVAESGATYDVDHFSIGTFTPAHMGRRDPDREIWTYDISKPNNVWKIFDPHVKRRYPVDTGRDMPIVITGIDTGFAEAHVFNYIERSNHTIIGLKGDKDHKYTTFGDNSANWRESPSRADGKLFLLKISKLKDQLANRVNLKWERNSQQPQPQPPGFMNFPQPADGKYDPVNFFAHFEAEERKADKNKNFMWQKKTPNAQNHFFDVAIYHMAVKEILMENVMKDLKRLNPTWVEFCEWMLSVADGSTEK